MRAYVLREFGEPPELADVRRPTVGDHDVLVRIVASSVNPVDAMIGAGGFRDRLPHRLPAVLGRDLAGTVVAAGSAVTRFRAGDEVFGFVKRPHIGDGTFAEYVAVPEDRYVIHRPPEVAVDLAGAAGLAAVTAEQCLAVLDLKPGATVLINGATGGVGAFAVQLAARRGLTVAATARPGAEEEHVRGLGAAVALDWSGGTVIDAARKLAPDGIVDLVSRDAGRFTALAATTPGPAASTLSAAPSDPRWHNVHSDGDPALLHRIAAELLTGLRVPLIDSYPLDRIDDAFQALAGAPLGKIGIAVSPAPTRSAKG